MRSRAKERISDRGLLDLAVGVSRKHRVSLNLLFSRRRTRQVAAARSELIVALYQVRAHSQAAIAALLGVTQPAVCAAIERHLSRQQNAA